MWVLKVINPNVEAKEKKMIIGLIDQQKELYATNIMLYMDKKGSRRKKNEELMIKN